MQHSDRSRSATELVLFYSYIFIYKVKVWETELFVTINFLHRVTEITNLIP